MATLVVSAWVSSGRSARRERRAGAITFILSTGVYYLLRGLVDSYLNIGPIRNIDIIGPSGYLAILLVLVSIRVNFYLVSVGYLTKYTIKDLISESISVFLGVLIVVFALILPSTAHSMIFIYLLDDIASIGPSHLIHSLVYAWSSFLFLVIFILDLGAEKEDRERFAAD